MDKTSIHKSTELKKICLQHASTQAGEPKVKDMKDSSVESYMPFMSYEDIKHDDNKIRFYTGFLSSSMFWLFFSILMKHGADRISYWKETQNLWVKKITMLITVHNLEGKENSDL